MEDECPICLEPLKGTIVHLECCKQKVHIQCYVDKCPFCRAQLPQPHVIVRVPVPVAIPVERELTWRQKLLPSIVTMFALAGFLSFITYAQTK